MAHDTRTYRPLTKEQNKAAFEHILLNIWGVHPDSTIHKSFQHHGFEEWVGALVDLRDDEVKLMKFVDDDGNERTPPVLIMCGQLRMWRSFISHRAANDEPFTPPQYVSMTFEDYEDFQRNVCLPQRLFERPSPPVTKAPIPPVETGKRNTKHIPIAHTVPEPF